MEFSITQLLYTQRANCASATAKAVTRSEWRSVINAKEYHSLVYVVSSVQTFSQQSCCAQSLKFSNLNRNDIGKIESLRPAIAMMSSMNLFILSYVVAASACKIQNVDSGVCTYKYLVDGSLDIEQIEQAKLRWEEDMPFCGKYVNSYAPCVPQASAASLPGWLTSDANVDLKALREKDRWVQEETSATIAERIENERIFSNKHRYFKNNDCQEAYKAYTCWLNFPRCDEFQESLPICASACENMFRVCGFEKDLWRCEVDVVDGEEEVEWNIEAFFPGQPFRKNEFKRGGEPSTVCTPSVRGGASTARVSHIITAGVVKLVLFLVVM